jgi:hypothetical protein
MSIREVARRDAVQRLGLKLAYERYSFGTGESGRLGPRTNENPVDQVNTAFKEHERHLHRDPADQSQVIPVGSGQSKEASRRRLQGRKNFRGLKISVENRKGGVRKWHDPHEKKDGRTKMLYPYGYIRGTMGADGDHVDCFVGPHEDAEYVYVIDTNKAPEFTEFDEQKCMLGFRSQEAARNAFHAHYSDTRFLRDIKAVPFADFKKKVLETLHGSNKKVASNFPVEEQRNLINNSQGSFNDQVPGDYLGMPQSSLIGLRKVLSEVDPQTKIERGFRSMDQQDDVRVMDGAGQGAPSGPPA